MGARWSILVGVVGVLFLTGAAQATSVAFFGGSPGDRAASVLFDYGNGDGILTVTLTNTSTKDVLAPTDVLTAVFFDTDLEVTFERVSAKLAPGSTVLFGSTDPDGVVGGEFAFNSGLSGKSKSALGLSSTGLDFFGPNERFPGTNLQGPDCPGGLQYGITSAGDDPLTGNKPVTGTCALIKNSVIFELSYPLADDFGISNVWFLYGTSLSNPWISGGGASPIPIPAVPEPLTMAMLGMGLVGAGRYVCKRRLAA